MAGKNTDAIFRPITSFMSSKPIFCRPNFLVHISLMRSFWKINTPSAYEYIDPRLKLAL